MRHIIGDALAAFFKHAKYAAFGRPRRPVTDDAHPWDKEQAHRRELGSVRGKFYLYWIDTIKLQKRLGQNDEAIALLLEIVDAIEREAAAYNDGVAPWYYEQLAILYRKQKRFADEVAILERYDRQLKAAGARPAKLAERLGKARALLAR